MPLQCPLPQGFEDGVIDMTDDTLAVDVAVIHRPTAYDPVEFCDQLPRRSGLRSSDNVPNIFQERMDVLARRFDQQLAAAVPSQVLSEEVEALFDMRDPRREFMGVRQIAAVVRSLRDEFNYPIFLDADHTHSLAKAAEAARARV